MSIDLLLEILSHDITESNKTISLYDLGCSTGEFIFQLANRLENNSQLKANHITLDSPTIINRFDITGVDNSSAMLKKANRKLKSSTDNKVALSKKSSNIRLTLIKSNLEQFVKQLSPNQSSAITLFYTLQFILPIKRKAILQSIYKSLRQGGVLLLSEKIKADQEHLDQILTSLYHNFKQKNGYSKLEIHRKRLALEKVLLPFTANEYLKLLQAIGFTTIEIFFKSYQFASFIAIK